MTDVMATSSSSTMTVAEGTGGMGGSVGNMLGGIGTSLNNQIITNDVWNHTANDAAWWRQNAIAQQQLQQQALQQQNWSNTTAADSVAFSDAGSVTITDWQIGNAEALRWEDVCGESTQAVLRQFEEIDADIDVIGDGTMVQVGKFVGDVRFTFKFDAGKEWTTEELQFYLDLITGKSLRTGVTKNST